MASSSLPSLHLHSPFLLSRSHASFLIARTRWTRRPLGFPRGRGTALAATLGPEDFSDLHAAPELFRRMEGWLYTLADAALTANTSPDVAGTLVEEGQKQGRDWLSGITDSMEAVLKVLNDGLSTIHVPYSYGFAIILLTILVKAATFPLTKKQVESTLAMKSLQPQVKAVQQRYAGDQERIQLETARLYKLAGVNPLAGCLPTLATIPVWIGLYRALSNVANEGLLTEGFFWIPSLSGPTTIGARQNGSGISWLFPFVDGHPPLGWPNTLAYLVLPVLLVVSQYISVQIMQPPTQGNDPNQKNAQVVTRFLPLMIGYFSLSVPSGLSLYWFTNNVLSTAQQIWLQKLGGAKNPVKEITSSIQTEIKAPRSSNETEITTLPSSNQTDSMVNIKKELSTEAKSGSGVAVPGERFRQIKEQEARRRQEREEDRRKVEEAAKESYSEDDCSKVSPEKVNGSHANQEERIEVLYPGTNNGGIAHNSSLGTDDSPENAQKEETMDACTSIKNQREQTSENDSTMQQQAASKQKSSILKT